MKEYFVYLAETRHPDILYKKAEGKLEVFLYRNYTVRVKGGMSLRNGKWLGLRNDIIMRNLIYAAE